MSDGWFIVLATMLTIVSWANSGAKLWKERRTISRKGVIRISVGELLFALLVHWFAYGSDLIMKHVLYPGKTILKHSHEESVLGYFQFAGAALILLSYLVWNRSMKDSDEPGRNP